MAEDTDQLTKKLFNQFPPERPYAANEKQQAHLLDQYKLYVEMADRISARRQTANSYFLSINTALVGFVGYITSKESGDYYWLLPVAGVALSYLWYHCCPVKEWKIGLKSHFVV